MAADDPQDVSLPGGLNANRTSSAGGDGSAVALGRNQTSGSSNVFTPSTSEVSKDYQPSLIVGALLCERFRIVRFIDKGGMGEVYEAEDLELNERVALKTLLPEIARDERAIQRFKREISLARKISSAQVCRINDLVRHKPSPDGPAEQHVNELTFLTMELLEGQSLAALLRLQTRLSCDEAFPLVKQMAEGLAAAHRVKVIHRDFKSSNVMLVSAGERFRAVVTDFGLARSNDSDAHHRSLTGSDDIAGTPAYMAPEQVEGSDITPSADIYALGIVMYEMVTGTLPFICETRIATAIKRLKESPVPPSRHVPGLDPRWDQTILRAMARRPEDRFAHATDVIDALQGTIDIQRATWSGPSTWSGSTGRRKRKWRLPVALAFVLLAVLTAVVAYRALTKARPAAVADARPTTAVVGMTNLSARKEDAWMATALAEMISTELASGDEVRVVPGDDVARAKIELLLPDQAAINKDNLPLIASDVGASFLITGSYSLSGTPGSRELRLDLHLLNKDGTQVAAIAQTGNESSISEVASQAAAKLRQKLGVANAEGNAALAVQASVPANPQSARLYAEGLARLRAFDAVSARDLLERAAAMEKSPAIHSNLALAWKQLGYDGKAADEAKLALDMSKTIDGLPRDFQFGIEARYDEFSHQWDKAMDLYSSLRRFYPGKLEYGLRLAATQTEGGKPDQALATYADLKKSFPSAEANDPRIDLGIAEANERLGRPEEQRAAASAAAQKADALKAKLLEAPALVNECIALDQLGKFDDARKTCEQGQQIYAVFGDQMGAAWATNNIGNVLTDKGDIPAARSAYELALAVATKVGAKGHMTGALMNIGKTYFVSGDNNQAGQYYAQSLALATEIGNQKQTSLALNNLAAALYSAGKLKDAQSRFEDAVRLAAELGDDDTQAEALSNIALIQTETAQLPEARGNYDRALDIWKKLDAKPSIANGLAEYAEMLSLAGDAAGAAKKIQDAITLAQQLQSKSTTASVMLSAGQVEVDAGHAAEAVKNLSSAIAEFQAEQDPDSEIYARAYLARAFLLKNKVAEAGSALEPVAKLKSSVKLVNLEADISRGAWMLKSEQAEAGRKLLAAAAAASRQSGLTRLEFEAEITQLEGQPPKSRTGLKTLHDRISAAGYLAFAQRIFRLQ